MAMNDEQNAKEIPESVLQKELHRREHRRQQGLCDYCGRNPSTAPCAQPTRHSDPRIKKHDT